MKPIYKRLLVTALIALPAGGVAIVPVVRSENGYVAGFVFIPFFVLVCFVSFVLFLAGLITVTKKPGPPLLLAAVLIPVGFFGAAMISKQLELGAYREDPMIELPAVVSNIVLFKEGATDEQIEDFWENVLSTRQPDGRGHWPLPGVQAITRLSAHDGHEVVAFSFHAAATDDQKEYVYQRVRLSPIVHEFRENVLTEDYLPSGFPRSETPNEKPNKIGLEGNGDRLKQPHR